MLMSIRGYKLLAHTVFLILIVSCLSCNFDSKAFATDKYRLYVHNRNSKHYYRVRITNEDSRKKDSLTVEPKSCNVFDPTDEGEYSVRVYRNGTTFSDNVSIEIDDTSCIELNSVTGSVSLCDKYWCTD
jgi:hypothetical protein